MPCRMLHTIEEPDRDAYTDPEMKDVVGDFPRFFCAQCTPLRTLKPSETVLCLDRDEPCWNPEVLACSS